MSVARSVADVLAEHVSFEVECIDRMYCSVYVPQLQYPAGLAAYVHHQLGLPIASTAPLAATSAGPAARPGAISEDEIRGAVKAHWKEALVALLAL